MKKIVEYAAENKLNPLDTKKLQDKMDQLKEEVASLQIQLHPSQVIH